MRFVPDCKFGYEYWQKGFCYIPKGVAFAYANATNPRLSANLVLRKRLRFHKIAHTKGACYR